MSRHKHIALRSMSDSQSVDHVQDKLPAPVGDTSVGGTTLPLSGDQSLSLNNPASGSVANPSKLQLDRCLSRFLFGMPDSLC